MIAPNTNSKELMKKCGVTSHIVTVGVWDYLMTPEQEKSVDDIGGANFKQMGEKKIAFAGNLNKSTFLLAMDTPRLNEISMELWGKLAEDRVNKLPVFCNYHGLLTSEDIAKAISGMDFGLVWDGSGSDEIQGGLGEYLRFNNSHKCGLYLAAGLPVIVWSMSGMAEFVRQNKCGICIDKLSDLSEQIISVPYLPLKENTMRVAKNIRSGVYFSNALSKACMYVENQ